MVINLSEETVSTVCTALRDAQRTLKKQTNEYTGNKLEIAENQLREVEDALAVFEELENIQ